MFTIEANKCCLSTAMVRAAMAKYAEESGWNLAKIQARCWWLMHPMQIAHWEENGLAVKTVTCLPTDGLDVIKVQPKTMGGVEIVENSSKELIDVVEMNADVDGPDGRRQNEVVGRIVNLGVSHFWPKPESD